MLRNFIPQRNMALFSFRHSVKTFSPKCRSDSRKAKFGQTAAHLKYITRKSAARVVFSARLPDGAQFAARNAEAAAKKKNGRVCERFIIALPVEANAEERLQLAREFGERLSRGKASYLGAIHDKSGNDKNNPHAHFVFFDAHTKSGGRGRPRSVLGLARKNAVQDAAKLWADTHNSLMLGWGYGKQSLISHLSFADRGMQQVPTIHEGAASRRIADTSKTPKSDWAEVDSGRTRAEANALIRKINSEMDKYNDNRNRLAGFNEGSCGKCKGFRDSQRKCRCGGGDHVVSGKPPFLRNEGSKTACGGHTDRKSNLNLGSAFASSAKEPPFVSSTASLPLRRTWRSLGSLFESLLRLNEGQAKFLGDSSDVERSVPRSFTKREVKAPSEYPGICVGEVPSFSSPFG